MAAEIFCNRNKFGYCKFGETCKFLHVNELCSNVKCDKRSCSFRHPKECLYFRKYKNCKFGEYCKYNHEICETNNENLSEYTKLIENFFYKITEEILYLKT